MTPIRILQHLLPATPAGMLPRCQMVPAQAAARSAMRSAAPVTPPAGGQVDAPRENACEGSDPPEWK
jgi:hypothetical protein